MEGQVKICLISQNASPGLLIFRKTLIQELVAQGHEVFCFAIDYDEIAKQNIIDLGAMPIDYIFSRTGLNPFQDLKSTWALARHFKTLQPDLVFAFFAKPVIYGTLAAWLAGVKQRVGMLEGLGYAFTKQPVRENLKKKLLRLIQVFLFHLSIPLLKKIIFLNPDDPKDLLDKYHIRAKQTALLGGIGVNFLEYTYSSPTKDKIRFIFIGRLLAEKGIYEYIKAASLVKMKYPDTEFVVLGGLDKGNPGGLKERELEKLIAGDAVAYPGHVDNVSQWIAESSVFVLPSYREGVPCSTQEAMAIGRAIITTDVPGCRETVMDGVNGFLIPPWSSEILAEKMCYFIQNPRQIDIMGKASRKMAEEKFDVQNVNKRLMSLLLDE